MGCCQGAPQMLGDSSLGGGISGIFVFLCRFLWSAVNMDGFEGLQSRTARDVLLWREDYFELNGDQWAHT